MEAHIEMCLEYAFRQVRMLLVMGLSAAPLVVRRLAVVAAVNSMAANLSKGTTRQLLAEWFATKKGAAVEFREETEPKNDPQSDDYFVVYEAFFEPISQVKCVLKFG
jgi:hypothetical protein